MPIEEEYLRNAYLVQHKTMQEIADELGCTKQLVFHYKKKYRLQTVDAEWVDYICDTCKGNSKMTRGRYRKSLNHFCCHSCYMDYLRNDEYRQRSDGQRIARSVVEKQLCRELKQGEVVHHIDSDNMNNDNSNLIEFGSHSDHMKHHHKLRQDRLKLKA